MDSELDEMTGVTLDEGMRAVLEVARALAVITSRDELLDRIVRTCAEGLGFGSASVAILDEDGRLRLKAIASRRGDLTLDAMAGYSLALEDLETLLGIATRIGDLYWVDGREPFLAELEARGAIVATTPSVPSSEWHPRSLLMAPLYRPGNEIFGVVFSDDPLDGRIPDSSRAILISALAHLASLTIQLHESRSYADAQLRILRAQRQRLEDLFRASSEVQRAQRLEEVLQTSADAVTHAGGFKRAAIYLRSGDRLELRVTSGVEPEDRAKLVAHGSIELASFSALMQPQSRISRSYLFVNRRTPMTEELAARLSIPKRPAPDRPDRWAPEDSLTIPIMDQGKLLGVIQVDEPVDGRYPDLEQVQALEFFADQAGLAVAQALQYDELKELAETDPLTGLLNRRSFWVLAEELVLTARAQRVPLCAMFIDLDHFKSVNDRFGHSLGDEVIREAAQSLRGRLRAQDLLARFGGEEFVVALTGVDALQAAHLAESLRFVVASVAPKEQAVTVTASIGVALADPSARHLGPHRLVEELLRLADSALYEAKARGRNRVELARQVLG